jgi:hypothetical protein
MLLSSARPLAGVVLVVAMLAVASGCAKPDWIQQTLVTADVTGTWRSTEGPALTLILKQLGTRVTGTVLLQPSSSSTGASIEGTVAGDVFRFTSTSGSALSGEMTVSGDEMSGQVQSTESRPALRGAVVRLQRSTSQP